MAASINPTRVPLIIAAVFMVCIVGVASKKPNDNSSVPRLSVNLDEPAEERWNPVLKHWDAATLRKLLLSIVYQTVPLEYRGLIDVVGQLIGDLLPEPYAGEISGIAKTLNITAGEIVVINLLYDFTAACTSIVAQDTNGTIWHGRNLDYQMTDLLTNITAILDFKSKGKTIYTTTTFIGQVGVFTGMKPGRFTISLNERDKGSHGENIVEILQALVFKKVKFTSFVVRDALANDENFDDALYRLVQEKDVAPSYLILGGVNPGEGAVITREREYTLDVWRLDVAGDRWFLLETNYDRWTTPPSYDDRRDPGNKAMRAVGQKKINSTTMGEVLSIQPVLNDETIYTALMCAARPDVYSSKIRHLP